MNDIFVAKHMCEGGRYLQRASKADKVDDEAQRPEERCMMLFIVHFCRQIEIGGIDYHCKER